MSRTIEDAASGASSLVFPDYSVGDYELVENIVYDAEEVRDDLDSEVPQYGDWVPVRNSYGDEMYLVAPSALLTELSKSGLDVGETFSITAMDKTGQDESDPYRVQVEYPDRRETAKDQAALGDD